MPIEVTMAKLSPTMESGQMVRWLVKVGDKVKEGDTLAEIQTDKAVMPMETFEDGVVAHLDVKEGEDIALGQRVLVLAGKGEDAKAIGEQLAKSAGSGTGVAKGSPAVSQDAGTHEPTPTEAHNEAVAGSNGQGAPPAPAAPVDRVRSTPLARKIAAEAKVEIGTISGTGPGGRVVRSDVEAFLAVNTTPARAVSPATAAPSIASKPVPPPALAEPRPAAPVGQPVRVPHSPMRKTIAKRMAESTQSVPAIHVSVDVRIDKLMAVREALNASLAAEKIKLSVGDFVTKAAALALLRHPGVNASFEPEAIVMHPEVNVGIAVAMEGGLMVPVLRNADTLGLRDVRVQTETIVDATRSGTLKPNQMMGGTFTISNLGMFGVTQFDAIINLPEVAILAVGAGERRPVVEGNSLVAGTVMALNLTADHRAVDGVLAAEFMRTLKGFLEEPSTMLL